MEMNHTRVLTWNRQAFLDPEVRFIINQGGSRSSKTISICQLIILYALMTPNQTISIVRKTFPALRASVMTDFFRLLQEYGFYERNCHDKSHHIYTFPNNTKVEFFSVDDEQKVRGRECDIMWANEANELFLEDFNQLNFRCKKKLIFDFNPSESFSYLYELMERSNAVTIKSTVLDNPFLSVEQFKELENLQYTDPDLYRVFFLGERSSNHENIFRIYDICPKPEACTEFTYGLDFGFNHPTALVKVWHSLDGKQLHLEEMIYESHLTTAMLVKKMNALNIDKYKMILADAARPEIITDIAQHGYRIASADKRVKQGIDTMKSCKLSIEETSLNIKKEMENYKWKKHKGMILDEPIKLWDDGLDAARYATMFIKQNSRARI